jgi:hypothetical protein
VLSAEFRVYDATDMRLAINRAIIFSIVATFVGLTVIGILRCYSPIPYGMDWTDYLGFYADLLDGKYSAWFADMRGHRIIFARMLYWLDIRYFNGRFIFLIAANLVILCGVIAILIAYLRRLTSERSVQFVIGATICIMAVSWIQRNNLAYGSWGAQWFIAMLLPLVAFYWLARAQDQRRFFWLAMVAGFASAWTMGNGILVLPLLATLALCIELKPAHIATLVIASISTIALYFNLESSVLGRYWSTLTGDPIGAAIFGLAFLGNPFFFVVSYPLAGLQYVFLLIFGTGEAPKLTYNIFGQREYQIAYSIGLYIALASGAALIVAATMVAQRWFASGREAIRGALLTFLFYIIVTAAAFAAARYSGSRPLFGEEVGLVDFPQYTTPALLAWAALIVLGATSINLRGAVGIFVCAAILLASWQMVPVFGLRGIAVLHERLLPAMQAILHGSDDAETLNILGADPVVVRRLRGTKVSIFADEP